MAGLCLVAVVLGGCGGTSVADESSLPAQTGGAAESDAASTGSPAASAATSGERTRAPASTTAEATNSASTPSTAQPDTAASTTDDRVIEEEESEYEIHTIIARDRIPAILDPEFLGAGEAIEAYNEHEQVLGLSINGDHRAYPIPYLSQHEIVNDVVGGEPVAVTW